MDGRCRLIVAALVQRGDEVLLLREQGRKHQPPAWALPGGVVREGELLSEAVAREVRAATGLEVLDAGELLFVAQLDSPEVPAHAGDEQPSAGTQTLTFVFKVGAWRGDLPRGEQDRVESAAFYPIAEAIEKLSLMPLRAQREPVLAHLCGDARPGEVWLYRCAVDGRDKLIARLRGAAARR